MLGVTGATGYVGGKVAAGLAALGSRQRLIVRDSSRAPRLPGAEVAEASSYRDGEAMRRALDGVRTLFLVSAREAIDRVTDHCSAVDAAVDAEVQRIVYLSFMAAAPQATFTFSRDHFATEQRIRRTGLAFTFLRSSLYLDFLANMCGADGVIRGPAGKGRVAPVARDDVAAVAVAVLTGTGHDGRTYDLTGPERLTMSEIAHQLGEVTGWRIFYREETLEEARASRAPSGAPAWEIEGWVTTYAAIAAGEMDVVSDSVSRLTGHDPQTVRGWLLTHPENWRHLVQP